MPAYVQFTIGDYEVITAETTTLAGTPIVAYAVRQISTGRMFSEPNLYARAFSRACKLAGQIGA